MLNIVFLTEYFPPETGAPQSRLFDLARRLRLRGHSVTVLTALPNYPRGEVFQEYRKRVVVEEELEGIRVIRTWIWVKERKGFSGARRMLTYLSFTASSLIVGALLLKSHDAIIIESPPIFVGLSGWLLARWTRAAMVLNVSDLWPKSAVEMGVLKNRVLVKLAVSLEEFLYRKAVLISGQSRGILDDIKKRCPGKSTFLMTNGVAPEAYGIQREGVTFRKEIGAEEDFVVGYAGLHGLAQGLDVIIDAAAILAKEGQDRIKFVLVGDGPAKPQLLRKTANLRLTNVIFRPPKPHFEMPEVQAAFDVAVVPLRKLSVFNGVLPSKLFEAMAAGRPVIACAEGEVRALVEAAKGGLCIEPERPDLLAEAVRQLQSGPKMREEYGANGRAFVLRNFNREETAANFERILTQVTTQGQSNIEMRR